MDSRLRPIAFCVASLESRIWSTASRAFTSVSIWTVATAQGLACSLLSFRSSGMRRSLVTHPRQPESSLKDARNQLEIHRSDDNRVGRRATSERRPGWRGPFLRLIPETRGADSTGPFAAPGVHIPPDPLAAASESLRPPAHSTPAGNRCSPARHCLRRCP